MDNLSGLGAAEVEILLRGQTICELFGILPKHLIDHVVAIQVDRHCRNPALWFSAT